MSTRYKIEPVFDEERKRWKVDVPAKHSDTGKRIRAWFKTRDKAREFLKGTDDDSEEPPNAIIPPSLALDADTARARLEAAGLDMTLAEAVRELVAAREALAGAGSLLRAAKAYRAQHEARTSSTPFGKAVVAYLTNREDLRDVTLKSYRYTLERVMSPLAETMLADISTAQLEEILQDKAPTARKMHLTNLRVFWRWACRPPRQWAAMETVDALEAVRVSSDADISILSPGDVRALLKAAEQEGHAAAAAYAISVFAGVRMAELARLTWKDIHGEHIEIGKSVAKKHSRRLIPICNTLAAWLSAHRGDGAADSPIVPPNWIDVSKSVRRRAGWNVAARLLKSPPEPTRGEWPANACRHTCASVQVAIGTPLEDLVFKFGHSGGHDLLRGHYVSRMTKKQALEILATGPKGKKIKTIAAA